ncbi:hypothetical protein pb186bvf_000274 [Paramecium bursaria]
MQNSDSDDVYKPEARCVQCRVKKAFRQQSLNNDFIETQRQFDNLRIYDESELSPPIKKVKSNELDIKYQQFLQTQPTVCAQEAQQQDMFQDDKAQLYFLDDDQETSE